MWYRKRIGRAYAIKKNCDNIEDNIERIASLENLLLKELRASGIVFVRNGINTLPGIISLSFPGYDGEAILHRMDLMGICISTGSACDSKNTRISHVLRAIGLDEYVARGTIRISLGKENTEDDIHTIVSALSKIMK